MTTVEIVHRFETLKIADLLDYLVDATDSARALAVGSTRWLAALDTAYGYLLQQDAISYDVAAHAIRVESASEAGRTYVANGDCGCAAFVKQHSACWHRAAARIIRRALERREQAEHTALAQELINEARAAGCAWYGPAEALEGARARMDEVMDFASEWDAESEAQRAALAARIGAAQAQTMARAA